MMAALIGATIVLLALAFVLAPLLRARGGAMASAPIKRGRAPAIPVPPEALDEAAEALVRRMRDTHASCDRCGERPEVAPTFCSTCGRHVAGCPHCGARTQLPLGRFCAACGLSLDA